MVAVLLTSGTQLVMLGVIGEYLWRDFAATRRRPLFVVDSVVHLSPQSQAVQQEFSQVSRDLSAIQVRETMEG